MLPEWLEGPLRAALHDLQQPHEVPVNLRHREDPRDGDMLWVSERGSGWQTGITLLDGRGAALTVLIADQLQEQFFPESESAWGEARPVCPGHAHPAAARELDDEPWWVCPNDERQIARIGELE